MCCSREAIGQPAEPHDRCHTLDKYYSSLKKKRKNKRTQEIVFNYLHIGEGEKHPNQ